MSMLTREQAEPILALHASGEGITEISLRLGVSRPTVRSYVRGHRAPGGKPRPKPDHFAPFASYCRQRLTDDPHLSRPLLRQELADLGYPGSRMSFSRAMDRHELLQLACQNRHEQPPAPVRPHPPGSNGPARPLPITVSPVSGETLSSYLGRVAAANHITATALLALLPRWFRTKIRDCDDRGQHAKLLPAAAGALHQLAAVTGSTSKALAHALPVFTYFTGDPARPIRATTACQRCLAANGIHQPVPILLAAHLRICSRHQLWLPGQRPAPARSISLPGHHRRPAPGPAPAAPLHPAAADLRAGRRSRAHHRPCSQIPRPSPRTGSSASACSRPATPAPAAQRRPRTSSSPQRSTPTQSHSRPRSSPGYSTDTRPGERPSATPQTPAGRIRRDNRTPNPRQTGRRPGQTSRNSP